MKRLTFALILALLLALCACGEAEAPGDEPETFASETTLFVEPFSAADPKLEPVILSVIQADWDDWAYVYDYEPPEQKNLGSRGVDIGSAVGFNTWAGDATITVIEFDAEAVTVRFQTSGMVNENANGAINLNAYKHDWIAPIPYGEAYNINSQSDDGGTGLIFTFTKNHL